MLFRSDGEAVVFCAVCGDTEGGEVEVAQNNGETRTEQRPPTGYAPVNLLQPLGWVKEGDQLVCGNPECVAEVSGVDADELRDLGVRNETISPEEVERMSPISSVELDSVDELDDADSKVEFLRMKNDAEEEDEEEE